MLDFLRKRHETDFQIDLPGVEIAVNHTLRIVFLYDYDTTMPAERYKELEAHLQRKHYLLQVIVAPTGMPLMNGSGDGSYAANR